MKLLLYRLIASVLSILLAASPAWSAEFDPVASGMRMLGGLIVVLAIILGLYYFLRKRLNTFQNQGKGAINVVEIKHVQPKKTLMLIEVRGREYLVGSGGDSINTIIPLQHGDSFSSHLKKSAEKL